MKNEIKTLYSDRGGKYTSKEYKSNCGMHDI